MESNKTLAGLSRYIKKSPSWYYFAAPVFLIFIIDYIINRNLKSFLFLLVLPFFILIFLDFLFIKPTNKSFNNKRIVYMDFISLSEESIFFWIIYSLNFFINLNIYYIISLSIAFASFLRVLILFIYYPKRIYISFIISMNYTYSFALLSPFFFAKIGAYISNLIPLIITSMIFVIFAYLYINISTRSFSRKYGASVPEIVNFFLSKSNDGQIGETFFRGIYNRKSKIPVKTIDIRKNGISKVKLIFPYVHPGPFGNLCSSNLPVKLMNELQTENIMVFHTSTTNSNNCGGTEDIKNIADAVKISIKKMKYTDKMSDFAKFNVDGYDVSLQKFDDFGFSAIIPEKKRFDDISLEGGLKLIKALKKAGAKDFSLLDAQNGFTRNASELDNCTIFIDPLIKKFNEIKSAYDTRIGYARLYRNINGLAEMGVQAIVMYTGKKYNALVLTDSNNITSNIMEAAKNKLGREVSNIDIYTTDNHVVNVGNLDINPLGMNCDEGSISQLIYETVLIAKKDIEKVEVGMNTAYADVYMGRADSFQDLMVTIHRSIKIAKYSIAFILLISIILSIYSFRYLPFIFG